MVGVKDKSFSTNNPFQPKEVEACFDCSILCIMHLTVHSCSFLHHCHQLVVDFVRLTYPVVTKHKFYIESCGKDSCECWYYFNVVHSNEISWSHKQQSTNYRQIKLYVSLCKVGGEGKDFTLLRLTDNRSPRLVEVDSNNIYYYACTW